jgi:hypothetical protein
LFRIILTPENDFALHDVSFTLETADQFVFLFIVEIVELFFVHKDFLVEEEALVCNRLDLGADLRANQPEEKCFGFVADIEVG